MSIRSWLGYTHPMFRSVSSDIGYWELQYANGIFVAVGGQKGFDADAPTIGDPVTCAGCSWSSDGVNWTDAQLPYRGTTTQFISVAYNGSGVWCAVGVERVNGVFSRVLARSLDNAKTWTLDPAGYQANLYFTKIRGGRGKFVMCGQTTNTNRAAYAVGTTGLAANFAQTLLPAGRARITSIAQLPNAGTAGASRWVMIGASNTYTSANDMATAFTETLDPNYGFGGQDPGTARDPKDLVAAPFAGQQFWGLISDSLYNSTPERYRNVWYSTIGTVWGLSTQLPITTQISNYYALAWNGQVLVASGDGVVMATRTAGVNSWRRIELPAGQWSGIASDGTDFVCVSRTGERLRISGSSIATRTP